MLGNVWYNINSVLVSPFLCLLPCLANGLKWIKRVLSFLKIAIIKHVLIFADAFLAYRRHIVIFSRTFEDNHVTFLVKNNEN